ncbi:MAG: hypothetical protein Q7S76_03220 [bacterium]|nr:hypothetical protein [bacterium]
MDRERIAHVFYVEDQRATLDGIRELLELDGHSVVAQARSVSQASEIIPKLPPKTNIAILDGDLGDGTGNDVIVLLKNSGWEHLFTIGFAGDHQYVNQASVVIEKPNADGLLAAIEVALLQISP